MKCAQCGVTLPGSAKRCINPKCRHWNLVASVGNISDYTVRLGDAAAFKVPRVVTGLVDKVFGGGIAQTSVNLLAGEPGAGKTTLSLQLSDIFCRLHPGRDTVIIANEQSADEIQETANRLDLKHVKDDKRIVIVKAMGGVTFDIGALLTHFKPCLVTLDSLTKWVGGDLALAVKIAQQLKDFAVFLKCPVNIVNQVTKDDDHAGLKQLQHAVDWTGKFTILEGELDPNGNPIPKPLSPRCLESEKNRFGPAPEEQFFQMTAKGLVEIELEPLG